MHWILRAAIVSGMAHPITPTIDRVGMIEIDRLPEFMLVEWLWMVVVDAKENT